MRPRHIWRNTLFQSLILASPHSADGLNQGLNVHGFPRRIARSQLRHEHWPRIAYLVAEVSSALILQLHLKPVNVEVEKPR